MIALAGLFNYPVQAVGYLPRVSVLVVIWVFAVLMPAAVLLDYVYKKILNSRR